MFASPGIAIARRGLNQLVEEKARDADCQQVEHDAKHYLVNQVVDREHRQQRSHRKGRQDGSDYGDRYRLGETAHHSSRESRGQELALDRDIDHTGPFAQDPAEGTEDEWGG